jgi:GPI mannosyltransferase 2
MTQTSVVDRFIDVMFGGFRRWDALYFLHIAEHGYSYENTLAFFPLFPLSVRVVANSLLLPLQYCASYANVLLVSAVLVNFLSFVLSATTLYQLSKQLLCNDALAYRAVQLYCVNPASIFFSAAYSEPMYALLAWQGMLAIERNRQLFAACCFALSGAVRSNGLINIGFVLYWLLRKLCARIGERGKTSVSGLCIGLCLDMFFAAFYTVICLVPFIIFQYFAFTVYCNPAASYRDLPTDVRRYGTEQGYKMPYSGLSAWCHFAVPFSYSYVQSTHWNVGVFKYYELKQLPNFALATPMALLTSYAAYSFVRDNPVHCLMLGLKNVSDKFEQKKNDDLTPAMSTCRPLLPPSCFVYVVHVTCLLVFGVLCMHVQVSVSFLLRRIF